MCGNATPAEPLQDAGSKWRTRSRVSSVPSGSILGNMLVVMVGVPTRGPGNWPLCWARHHVITSSVIKQIKWVGCRYRKRGDYDAERRILLQIAAQNAT